MKQIVLFIVTFTFLASATGNPLCKHSLEGRKLEVQLKNNHNLTSLVGLVGKTELRVYNSSLALLPKTREQKDELETEINAIYDMVERAHSKFPNMEWPKKLFVQYSQTYGTEMAGGPNWIVLEKGVSKVPTDVLSFNRALEPILIHELGHTFVSQAIVKKTGNTKKIEDLAVDWFEQGKNFAKLNHDKSELMELMGESSGNFIFSFYLQEMSSDLLTSLYFKNHDIMTEYFDYIQEYLPPEHVDNPMLNRREVIDSGFEFVESLRIVSSTFHNLAFNILRTVQQKIFVFENDKKFKKSGLTMKEFLKQNPEIVERGQELTKSKPIEVLNLYNYVNEVRRFLVKRGYYLKAIKNGKEDVLIKAVEKSIVQVSLAADQPGNLATVDQVNLLKNIFSNNSKLKKAIENNLEDAGF